VVYKRTSLQVPRLVYLRAHAVLRVVCEGTDLIVG